MPTHDFKAFATGNGAIVISQAEYLDLAGVVSGFSSGKASSAQGNKALRQATVMANVLAQFIADSANVDVLDDGNTAA
ncbi:phage tail protein, partial [Klebsiella pneumoniae]|nr:phage tail protein [Klebsiella pneumoniae]